MPTRRITEFELLTERWSERLRIAFLKAIENSRDLVQLTALANFLAKGDIESALRAVGLDPANFRPLDVTIQQAYETAGTTVTDKIPAVRGPDGLKTYVQFDVRNPLAEQWLREHSGTLIREIVADQRDMLRSVMTYGMEQGWNPKKTALDIAGRIGASGNREGSLIGLTESQWEWVKEYEAALRSDNPLDALTRKLRDRRFDGVVKSVVAADGRLSEAQIEIMMTAYRNRALRYRAEAISRSEAIEALHAGQQQALDQAVGTGAVAADDISEVWRTSRDRKVRDAHKDLEGKARPYNGVFQTKLGPIRYPGDPKASAANRINCRCHLEIQIDFLRGIR